MEVVRFADAPFYTAPDHDDIVARRLQGGDASAADFVLVGHSTFATGAAAPMGAGPTGKIYVVTEGALTTEQALAARCVLLAGDSVFVLPNEPRAIRNEGDIPAAMIVITPPALA